MLKSFLLLFVFVFFIPVSFASDDFVPVVSSGNVTNIYNNYTNSTYNNYTSNFTANTTGQPAISNYVIITGSNGNVATQSGHTIDIAAPSDSDPFILLTSEPNLNVNSSKYANSSTWWAGLTAPDPSWGSPSWSSVTGKPTTYPNNTILQDAKNYTDSTNTSMKGYVDSGLAGKMNTFTTWAGLLNTDVGATQAWVNLQNYITNLTAQITESQVTNLISDLNKKFNSSNTTDNLNEGTNNLYFTNARARGAISNGSSANITWNSTTGKFDLNLNSCTGNNFFHTTATDSYNLSCQAVSFAGYAPLASPSFTGTVTIPTPFTIGAVSMTATGTELNYVAGVTSAIQTQLNGKQASGNYAISPVDINDSTKINTTNHNSSGSNNYCTTCHIFKSPLTTKGDINVYGTAVTRLPIGTNNQVLTADSTQTLGMKWATPASSSSSTTPTTILLYSSRGSVGVTKPGPLTELDTPYSRTPVNLTGFNNMRVYFVDNCSASTANAQVGVDYSIDRGSSWTNVMAFNHTCPLAATYFNQTTYTAIPAGAKKDVLLRAVIDPATTMIVTQVGVEIN